MLKFRIDIGKYLLNVNISKIIFGFSWLTRQQQHALKSTEGRECH